MSSIFYLYPKFSKALDFPLIYLSNLFIQVLSRLCIFFLFFVSTLNGLISNKSLLIQVTHF